MMDRPDRQVSRRPARLVALIGATAVGLVSLALWPGHLPTARAVAAVTAPSPSLPGQTFEGAEIPFTTIAWGTTSGIRTRTELVIRNATAWADLWARHAGSLAPLQAVRFDTEMVIAVFAGEVPASSALKIGRILNQPERLVVVSSLLVRESASQPDRDRRTTPFHIVRLGRSPLPVQFVLMRVAPIVPPGP